MHPRDHAPPSPPHDQPVQADPEPKPDPKPKKKTTKRKPARRTAHTLTADLRQAIAVSGLVATADDDLAGILARLSPTDVGDPVERHAATVTGLLTLPPTTVEALRTVTQLAGTDDPVKVAFTLGGADRRELTTIAQVAATLAGADTPELPDGPDAVVEIVGLLDRIRDRRHPIEALLLAIA